MFRIRRLEIPLALAPAALLVAWALLRVVL
jgi:hypothetical protein